MGEELPTVWEKHSPITDLAIRYGVLPETLDHSLLFRPFGKSGLTPATPAHHRLITDRSRAREDFLKSRLYPGFTPEILRLLGAFPYETTLKDLTNPIHPILEYSRWQTENHAWDNRWIIPMELPDDERFVREEDNNGLWVMSNPAVQRRLEPILRLCTRFLIHSGGHTWMKALLFGERTPVPDALDRRDDWRKAETGPLQYFHLQNLDPHPFFADSALQHTLKKLANDIQFSIGSGTMEPPTRKQKRNGYYDAVTTPYLINTGRVNFSQKPIFQRVVVVDLSWQALLPLFRNDLKPGEQMCTQFFLAHLLMHELAHAVGQVLKPWFEGQPIHHPEPVFGGNRDGNGEDAEFFKELGYSFANSIFGGSTPKINPGGQILGAPIVGCYLTNDDPNNGYDEEHFLFEAGMNRRQWWPTNHYTPIVATYYENVHTDDFWEVALPTVGPTLMAPTPAALRSYEDLRTPGRHTQLIGVTTREWMDITLLKSQNTQILASLTPQQRAALEIANKLRDDEFNESHSLTFYFEVINNRLKMLESDRKLQRLFEKGIFFETAIHFISHVALLCEEAKGQAKTAFKYTIPGIEEIAPTNPKVYESVLDYQKDLEHLAHDAIDEFFVLRIAFPQSQRIEMRRTLAETSNMLFIIRTILTKKLRSEKTESPEQMMLRVQNELDPAAFDEMEKLRAEPRLYRRKLGYPKQTLEVFMEYYKSGNLEQCRLHAQSMIDDHELSDVWKAVMMVVMATDEEEPKGKFLAREGSRLLNEGLKHLPENQQSPLWEEWVKVAEEIAISWLGRDVVKYDVVDSICKLGLD